MKLSELTMSKIFNSIILNNEIWALDLRLEYEYNFFDKIFITESRQSFSGEEKLLYFDKYLNRFKKYLNKIEYLIIDELPKVEVVQYLGYQGKLANENRWPLESYQRNYAKKSILACISSDLDSIVLQDVDEFYSIDSLSFLHKNIHEVGYVALLYNDYRGSIYKKDKSADYFRGGYICNSNVLLSSDLHDIRRCYLESGDNVAWHIVNPGSASNLNGSPLYHKYNLNFPYHDSSNFGLKAGWHFSNMTGGDSSIMTNKLMSFSHSEFSPARGCHHSIIDYHQQLSLFLENRNVNLKIDDIDSDVPDFIMSCLNKYSILIK